MDIREVHALFLQYLAANETQSRATLANHRSTMLRFLGFAPETRWPADITRLLVERFLIWGRLEQGWAPSTHHSHLKHLSKFCAWAVEHEMMRDNPCLGIKRPPLGQHNHVRLSRDQALWAIDAAGHLRGDGTATAKRNQAIVAMFVFAGLRKNELLKLDLSDVDIENEAIAVRSGKGDKDRLLPMAPRLKLYLQAYLRNRRASVSPCRRFFLGARSDVGLSEATLKRVFLRLRAILGVRVYPHMLRHTFATLMLEGGCDVYSLSKMLGHKKISTTTIYLDATIEHLRGEITKHPLNFRFGGNESWSTGQAVGRSESEDRVQRVHLH